MKRKRAAWSPIRASQEELLTIVLSSRTQARRVMEVAGGDVANLSGMDIEDLGVLVGESTAAKLAAVFGLLHHLVRRRAAAGHSALDRPLGGANSGG